jgi:hypothetical protein
VGIQATSAGYFSQLTQAATAGAWVVTTATVTLPITVPVEGTNVQRSTAIQNRVAARVAAATGQPASSSANTLVFGTPAPVYFTGGTWVCLWWGTGDTAVTAGSYTGRAVTSINDSLLTDSVGV